MIQKLTTKTKKNRTNRPTKATARCFATISTELESEGFTPSSLIAMPEVSDMFEDMGELHYDATENLQMTRDEAFAEAARMNAKMLRQWKRGNAKDFYWHVVIKMTPHKKEWWAIVSLNGDRGTLDAMDQPFVVVTPTANELKRYAVKRRQKFSSVKPVDSTTVDGPPDLPPQPPLSVAIIKDGKVVRIVDLPDPREAFCREFNAIAQAGSEIAIPTNWNFALQHRRMRAIEDELDVNRKLAVATPEPATAMAE